MATQLAVDLGTANTLVWARGRGIVLTEPTVVAVEHASGRMRAFGRSAQQLVEQRPADYSAERPLRDGVVRDLEATAELFGLVLGGVRRAGRPRRPGVLLAVPGMYSEAERWALVRAAEMAGAAEARLIDEPFAAALGGGLPVQAPHASMIVDVGAAFTDVAVLSYGGIVARSSLRLGGFDVDAAIESHLHHAHDLMVGERTAERLKRTLSLTGDGDRAEVYGRTVATGAPATVTVGIDDLRGATEGCINALVEAVLKAFADCPPELTRDIMEDTVWLAGGGALLPGLGERVEQQAGLRVRFVDRPLQAVVTGAGELLDTVGLRRLFDGG